MINCTARQQTGESRAWNAQCVLPQGHTSRHDYVAEAPCRHCKTSTFSVRRYGRLECEVCGAERR